MQLIQWLLKEVVGPTLKTTLEELTWKMEGMQGAGPLQYFLQYANS